jgi:quinate dehydrogenase (quinone)
MFQIHPEVSPQAAAATRKPVDAASEQKDWNHYGNSSNNDRFAALDQINVDNVNQLQVAWTFHTGDVPKSTGAGAEDQLTPLQVGDKVFLCTPSNNVIALDADTGSSCGAMTPTPMWAVCGNAAAAWPISMPKPLAQPSVPGSTRAGRGSARHRQLQAPHSDEHHRRAPVCPERRHRRAVR